ncbi:50S ribosomal protein L7ae [Williamsoniiplasma luminosum]|uniref:50S ribosomal protein L7 n=1 Tax=Williamsoniiplasma luminosum TaxID=214888 RepID=A0A2K8NX34_9MOLU|nr:ribosomal L7Ae/L30e/S12e/Gadd45 family protein [Williamsoniiplasma luminosum]ATZ17193.1 50S ribosomal protein L7ae [Williamsoniiplasma luminosum]AVP49066.1 MAG: 50S ribosomal protein L7 [Williamsoniiplasma luminosum]
MNKIKLINNLGLARRSGKIIFGFRLLEAIKNNQVNLVIIATDMGESQKKKYLDKSNFYNIETWVDVVSIQELSQATGMKKVVAIGIKDKNMITLFKQSKEKE